MSETEMNSYRLMSMEEPGDERMAQIMREVAEDARESTCRAANVWPQELRLRHKRHRRNGGRL